MRERAAAILFVVILAFLGVFAVDVFYKLFIEADKKFTESASAAFFGAFLAFVFCTGWGFFQVIFRSDRKEP